MSEEKEDWRSVRDVTSPRGHVVLSIVDHVEHCSGNQRRNGMVAGYLRRKNTALYLSDISFEVVI